MPDRACVCRRGTPAVAATASTSPTPSPTPAEAQAPAATPDVTTPAPAAAASTVAPKEVTLYQFDGTSHRPGEDVESGWSVEMTAPGAMGGKAVAAVPDSDEASVNTSKPLGECHGGPAAPQGSRGPNRGATVPGRAAAPAGPPVPRSGSAAATISMLTPAHRLLL